ncbi:MAG: dehydrogenase [Planctomycetes bacterium]|jgi:predicted dehydrogenase|nr:dehydrogenase [Planctomycetota bacterium]
MKNLTRRRFLEDSLIAAAAATGVSACQSSTGEVRSSVGRDDPLRVAVIGVRGRGRAHVKAFKNSPDSEVVAICDVDSAVIEPALAAVPRAKYHRDMRSILEDPTIDAVSFATPNHWHSLGTLWALEAGKHVYVEKPLSHNLAEGRAVVDAARRFDRIVQHGTQARSARATSDAIAWLHGGGLGRTWLATGLCYKVRNSIGKVTENQTPPATLDYDRWIGPAEMRALRRKNLHYDWHWDFNTGNGDLGNQGVHQMDIARWGLGLNGFPRRVVSCGGRIGYDDDGDTPNTLISAYDYGEKQIVFEVRGLPTGSHRNTFIGVIFHCEGGYLVISTYEEVTAFDHAGRVIRTFRGGGNHFQNFLDAVKAGRSDLLASESLEGHISSGLCHLGNISYLLGEPRELGETDALFGRTWPAGNEAGIRMKEHLGDNAIAPSTPVHVGPELVFESETERFTGKHAARANMLCARAYRSRFSPHA